MAEALPPDERRLELTAIVLRSLALIQVGLVLAGLSAPVTRQVGEEPDPISVPGLFNALVNVRDPDELATERDVFLVVSAVVVIALLSTPVVALLLVGGQWYPGRLPLLQYLLAAVLVLGTGGLFLAGRWLGIEQTSARWFALTEEDSGGPAWGLWLPLLAAAWAVNLGRGVQRLAQ